MRVSVSDNSAMRKIQIQIVRNIFKVKMLRFVSK